MWKTNWGGWHCRGPFVLGICALAAIAGIRPAPAADEAPTKSPAAKEPAQADPPGLTRLTPVDEVWIDKAKKRVIVAGRVTLREGQLEMFACPKQTKEHESVVALDSKAFVIHTALLAVGAKPGTPVKYVPKYTPVTGPEIEILVQWTDKDGRAHEVPAQQWVRDSATKKALAHPWIFGGSGFWKDDEGKEHYFGESGDLICVSNFPSAMLDLPIKSSQSNDELMFEAFTENIPPVGTKIKLVLIPKPEKKSDDKGEKAAPPAATDK